MSFFSLEQVSEDGQKIHFSKERVYLRVALDFQGVFEDLHGGEDGAGVTCGQGLLG